MGIVAASKSSAADPEENPCLSKQGRLVSYTDLSLHNQLDAHHHEGATGRQHKENSVLQQHCAFFDRDGDGVIFPHETYEGMLALGYPPLVPALAGVLINGAFSYPTYHSWVLDPRFPIYIENVHRTKHGRDSEVYDAEGRFLAYKFEIFNKYAKTKPNAITYPEIIRMTDSIRNVYDPFGWAAAKLEWGFTYWLVKDDEGFASKKAIRGVYDGSSFDWIEQEIKKGQDKHVKEVELLRIKPENNR